MDSVIIQGEYLPTERCYLTETNSVVSGDDRTLCFPARDELCAFLSATIELCAFQKSLATEERYKNKGAYIVLVPPHFDSPVFHSFEAVTPRPEANPYYDYEDVIDSDEELDFESMGRGSSWKISSPPNIEAGHCRHPLSLSLSLSLSISSSIFPPIVAAEQSSMPSYHYPLHECHCLQNILFACHTLTNDLGTQSLHKTTAAEMEIKRKDKDSANGINIAASGMVYDGSFETA